MEQSEKMKDFYLTVEARIWTFLSYLCHVRSTAECGVLSGEAFISLKVFLKSFYRCQLPHKSVNLSSIIAKIKGRLTNLFGN